MGFQLSAGVKITEIDLTTVVPAVATTDGAIAGEFKWGPAALMRLIDSEETLVRVFGSPLGMSNPETFFTAANFLAYGNKLHVVRVADKDVGNNAVSSNDTSRIGDASPVAANTQYVPNDTVSVNTAVNSVGAWIAKFPGDQGNSLKISACPSSAAFGPTYIANSTANITFSGNSSGGLTASESVHAISGLVVGDVVVSNGVTASIASINSLGTGITTNLSSTTNISVNIATRSWEYATEFDGAPGTSGKAAKLSSAAKDELHVIVVDEDGSFSGVPKTVLEKFPWLSKASDNKTDDGSSNYYKTVLDTQSEYVRYGNVKAAWALGALVGNTSNWNTAVASGTVYGAFALPDTDSLGGGSDGTISTADVILGYDKFASAEDVDVSLVLGSDHNSTVAKHIVDNICEKRKDCIAVLSPIRTAVVNVADPLGTLTSTANSVLGYRGTGGSDNLTAKSSSYAILDSGWKYQFDKYNDVFRWLPLNGDTAGTIVYTDDITDPWFSPAGFSRGKIKNIVKLAWNPTKAQRDELYRNGVNPIVTFPGQGTVLYGDKTLLSRPSAFDRINVRRLFIILEKAIAKAAQSTLFEFNDEFTRAQFRNLVEPFLRDVQGRRGIIDFRVVADETNNTGEVIDRNEFVGDIYIKPARSINYIQLSFIAVRSGVEFSEIVGKF